MEASRSNTTTKGEETSNNKEETLPAARKTKKDTHRPAKSGGRPKTRRRVTNWVAGKEIAEQGKEDGKGSSPPARKVQLQKHKGRGTERTFTKRLLNGGKKEEKSKKGRPGLEIKRGGGGLGAKKPIGQGGRPGGTPVVRRGTLGTEKKRGVHPGGGGGEGRDFPWGGT